MGKGKREWGGRGGGPVYSQPGIRVDGDSHHDTEEGFQVSKGRVPRNQGRDFQATIGGLSIRIGACTSVYISC